MTDTSEPSKPRKRRRRRRRRPGVAGAQTSPQQRQPEDIARERLQRLNPAAMIDRLADLEVHRLRRVWLNGAAKLGDPKTPTDWREHASIIMEAVESEWQRRGIKTRLSDDDFFHWPSTETSRGDGSLVLEGRSEGMLSYLDYRVGRTQGQPPGVRRVILTRVFSKPLPRVFDDLYMAEWSTPSSARRLKKMADSLAAFARNFKQRDPDLFNDAIRDWEEDLEWLYERYYVGHFHFAWPSTRVPA